MNRSPWLAALAVALAPAPGFAQFGPQGQVVEIQRSAEVELEGGQRVSGEIIVGPLTVDSDIGRYAIAPDKLKMIRFLKPPGEVRAADAAEPAAVPKAAAGFAAVPGQFVVAAPGQFVNPMPNFAEDPLRAGMQSTTARGKIITAPGKDIIGNIYIPSDFHIKLDVGTLYPPVGKLRTIAFTDAGAEEGRAAEAARPAAAAGVPAQPDRAEAAAAGGSPTYFRQGYCLVVFTPGGNRVALYSIATRASQVIELSATRDASVEVSPLVGPDLLALDLNGPKITRIAVADLASGTWHPQDLRQPAEGRVSPILGSGIAVYTLGRYVYAYSATAHRWDVAELPEGTQAAPVLGPDGAMVQGRGHLYFFPGKTGRWEDIDLRAILDAAGAEKG